MAVMEKLKMFVAQEPVVAASCLIAGVGAFSSIHICICSLASLSKNPNQAIVDLYVQLDLCFAF